MPVRKIPRNGGSITGRVARYGGVGSLGYESFLEHDFIFVALYDPEVAHVEDQPVRIIYEGSATAGGRHKKRRYVPDFLLEFHDWAKRPPVLVEVKYRDHLNKMREELIPKIRAGQIYARERGWRYRVVTEERIRVPQLANIKFLLPFRRFQRDEARCQLLLDALSILGRVQAGRLLDACSEQGSAERGKHIACLWWLLSMHQIAADLTTPLSMSTELWQDKQPPRH